MAETYIGVSGVASEQQQRATERSFNAHSTTHGRGLLLGVKATTKTQLHEQEPKKGRSWFPVGDELRVALTRSGNSTKILQLYANDWTDLNNQALPLVDTSLERSTEWVDGLQYDLLPWMVEDSSLQIIERYAQGVAVDGPVILQCHGTIMAEYRPSDVIERLKQIEGYITHILFDASEGRGVPMNSYALSQWVEVIQATNLNLGIAIAGGLGPYRDPGVLSSFVRRFDSVSWDAESRLHTNNVLDKHKTSNYIDLSLFAIKMATKKDE